MGDIFSPQKRSQIMSRIKGKDTKIELLVRNELWKNGFRYRKNYGKYKIDIAFIKEKVAIFIDSCFWHKCPIHGTIPKTNIDFWEKKLTHNKERDLLVNSKLISDGWEVIRIWEHELPSNFTDVINKIIHTVESRR